MYFSIMRSSSGVAGGRKRDWASANSTPNAASYVLGHHDITMVNVVRRGWVGCRMPPIESASATCTQRPLFGADQRRDRGLARRTMYLVPAVKPSISTSTLLSALPPAWSTFTTVGDAAPNTVTVKVCSRLDVARLGIRPERLVQVFTCRLVARVVPSHVELVVMTLNIRYSGSQWFFSHRVQVGCANAVADPNSANAAIRQPVPKSARHLFIILSPSLPVVETVDPAGPRLRTPQGARRPHHASFLLATGSRPPRPATVCEIHLRFSIARLYHALSARASPTLGLLGNRTDASRSA